jgi:hypothetical protein
VCEVYGRVRSAMGDEHSAEVDPDEQAALVTAIVLHFQHGLPIASAFRQVRVLAGARPGRTAVRLTPCCFPSAIEADPL